LKKYVLSKVAILIATFVLYGLVDCNAQKHEFGASLSNAFYKGSLNRTPTFSDFNPSFSLFYRYNINPVVVFRPQFTFASIGYDDASYSNPLNIARKVSFTTGIYEFALLWEYNFFDYRGENKRVTWAPYLTGGVAGFANDSQNNISATFNAAIPMGLGLKFNLGKQWNLGTEFLARKTFADDIDGNDGLQFINGLQAGEANKTDWYYTLGVFLSYTIYTVNCPRPN
jgi:hypothetical protein